MPELVLSRRAALLPSPVDPGGVIVPAEYAQCMSHYWVRELRKLHDENFDFGWDEHIEALNAAMGLEGRHALGLAAPTLAPSWLVGDVEAVEPGRWVLVVSLNQARREEDEASHAARNYTPQSYWDHWRFLNRNWWEPRFYRPLVRLASRAMGATTPHEAESEFATTRMIFVEISPYPSREFALSADDIRRLATVDRGYRIATRVREILIHDGEPALVVMNGLRTVEAFAHVHRERALFDDWRRYASVHNPRRTLRHREGHYDLGTSRIPLLGMPFLRKAGTHNANSEIDQLGDMARALVRG